MPNYNYDNLLARARDRRIDPSTKTAQLSENFSRTYYPASLRYVIESMSPVGKRSTEIYYEEADRVKSHLNSMSGFSLDFDYQGSVPLDIHIRTVSDIDLLCINQEFYIPAQVETVSPINTVSGEDCRGKQRRLRNASVEKLTRAYWGANVDGKNCGKAIKISGGSLQRNIDVVITNWHNTNEFVVSKQRNDRAIDVYDADTHDRVFNHPFLHMRRVNREDKSFFGAHKRYVRLLKCIKEDFGINGLTSYDITAMMYHMNDQRLLTKHDILSAMQYLEDYLWLLHKNDAERECLRVPNETRYIFEWKPERKTALNQLWAAVYNIIKDMTGQVVFKQLDEGRLVDAI